MISNRKIKLISSDNEVFELDADVAFISETVKNMLEETDAVSPLPVDLRSAALFKAIEYCTYHFEHSKTFEGVIEEDSARWYKDYVLADAPPDVLYDLIIAANFLNIKGLLDLLCQAVADMIKGKTPDEIRELFGVENDFSPEEEEEVRRENAWAFE
jgi:S-phase kinase-associated protein 1